MDTFIKLVVINFVTQKLRINKYHIQNENECLYQCPDEYFSYINVCYLTFPDNNGQKLYAKDKECVPCTGAGEYYIEYKADDTNDPNIIRRCYSKCPADYLFHNYDKHACYKAGTFLICQEKNEEGGKVNPYFKVDDAYTCYPSCNETKYYKNEIEKYHCSKELNFPSYYYISIDVNICINEDSLDSCAKIGKKYWRGKECVSDCYDYEYKVLPKEGNIFIGWQLLGKCCLNKDSCGLALIFIEIASVIY